MVSDPRRVQVEARINGMKTRDNGSRRVLIGDLGRPRLTASWNAWQDSTGADAVLYFERIG